MGVPYYPQSTITPNLGLELKGMDEVIADDFIILDAFAGTAQSIQINSSVIPQTNFIDSNTVTFTVAGNNVSAHAAAGVDVNGAPIAAPNFNNLAPAAPPGGTNVLWQVLGGSISAYVVIPAAGVFPVTKAAIASNWLNSYDAVTGLFTATQPTFTDLSAHPTTLGGYGITDAISSGVMTTLGDMLYENVTPAPTRLSGNITVTKMYLSQTGTGAVSAAPVWAQINYADITGIAPVTAWNALTGTLSNGQVIPYGDTGISRLGAASLAIGNGTAGNTTGNLSLNRISKAGADFAGQATVTAGGTTKAVSFGANYAGTGQPVIILTPKSDPLVLGVPVGYWVTYSGGAGAWTGFTVNIQTALAGDVVFNYIVIGVA